jgi:hypothetical protein
LAQVRDRYIPEVGADKEGKRFAFSGYLLGQQKLLQEERRRRRSA